MRSLETDYLVVGAGAMGMAFTDSLIDHADVHRLCPPNAFPDDPAGWAQMQVRGTQATRAYGAEPDIAAWANGCALNPGRISPSRRDEPAVQAAAARLADVAERGLTRLAELADEPLVGFDRD